MRRRFSGWLTCYLRGPLLEQIFSHLVTMTQTLVATAALTSTAVTLTLALQQQV
nr:MAG TPA: hypothetical protein [Caudoviricetes sp.]